MKIVFLLLFPWALLAQTEPCAKSTILYSREIFPGPVTVQRTIALSGLDASCNAAPSSSMPVWPKVEIASLTAYRYEPLVDVPQDINGRDLFLGVVTDLLVKTIIYNQRQ